jgi:hypothetical protein
MEVRHFVIHYVRVRLPIRTVPIRDNDANLLGTGYHLPLPKYYDSVLKTSYSKHW